MEVLVLEEVAPKVERLIDDAKTTLILITPYFEPTDRMARAILARLAAQAKVTLILRGGKDRVVQEKNAQPFKEKGAQVAFLERLHAKVYVSDSTIILGSLNLLKGSMADSYEIAVRLERERDADGFKDVIEAVKRILVKVQDDAKLKQLDRSQEAKKEVERLAARMLGRAPARVEGFCVRCAVEIDLDPDHPLCDKCYRSWSKFEDVNYVEKHCHACGDDHRSTYAKPLCRPCWKRLSDEGVI